MRKTTRPLHPRLEQLDREMMRERTKQYDHLYAVGRGFRFRVSILRDGDGKFFATTQLGRAYRVQGPTPSSAVAILKAKITATLNWMAYAEKEAIRMAHAA